MNYRGFTFNRIIRAGVWRMRSFHNWLIRSIEFRKFRAELSLEQIVNSNFSRNDLYRYFQKSFFEWAPQWLRDHRAYFTSEGRGFGEDAFHAAWFKVICEFRPVKMLEVGVYRGQTISLWALIGQKNILQQQILGISPLDSSGDTVSDYRNLDYVFDINSNFEKFGLRPPELLRAYSTEPKALEIIENGGWDLIYIDGSHDYDVVRSDLVAASKGLKSGGILVMDDSSLYTDFNPSTNEAFRGHPGPSRAFSEINPLEFEFLFGVGHNNFLRKK